MIDELRPLIIFAKTAELGSFREAARFFNLSPSVVSYHISQLERRFGIALLHRSTRQVSLTHDGEQVFKQAMVLAEVAESCLDTLSEQRDEPVGKLGIALPAGLVRSELVNAIAGFARQFERVELSMQFSDQQQNLVKESIDLAVRTGHLVNSGFQHRKLMDQPRRLVCTPDYLKTQPFPRHIEDIRTWSWVELSMLPPERTLISPLGERVGVEIQSRIRVDSVDAMYRLSLAGLGLSTPPDFLVDEDLRRGTLVEVLPDWKVEDLPVYLLWPANTPKKSLTKELVDYLVNSMAPVT